MERRTKRAAGLLACVLSAAVALAPTMAAARPAIVSHHHRFVPATGDWEGTANGFPASFGVAYKPAYRVYGPRVTQYGFEDLALLEPSGCPINPANTFETIVGNHTLTPVYAGGSLHLASSGIHGGLTSARTAKIWIRFRLPPSASNSGCSTVLTWHMHPAQRRRVPDGTWQLRFSDGETESFTVDGGGRVATGIAFPMGFGCEFGAVDMFIGPDGHANVPTAGGQVDLRFAGASASGTMTGTSGAGGCSLGMTATLSGHAP